ncbi:MAG: chorismate-binding protein [Prevotella sp.]|nr:chorismate-binding protein [Prevotella sp.]
MTGFALYRFPHEQRTTLVEQTEDAPLELLSCTELNGRNGFVVAPFAIDREHPIVLIRPDRVQVFETPEHCSLLVNQEFGPFKSEVCSVLRHPDLGRIAYGEDFRCFHEQLKTGTFRKLVLSRCAETPTDMKPDMLILFKTACRLYPRLFVSLTYTPRSGLWLTATPEVLLEGEGSRWRTIALAGTMKLEGEQLAGEGEQVCWSTKNIQEQRYVATYITECLKHFSIDIREEGPRTVRAANLVHLRSDFTFTLDNACVGDVLQMLHPTPAVCGLPKQEAFRFILEHEHTSRRYYSGFMGPLGIGAFTRLYVSLRCMQMMSDRYCLYAGGGLLRDSEEEQEWQETEAKLETMRQCIAAKTM